MKTKYRSEIDGLRAIAILTVVIYHAFPLFLPGGLVGVDVFFVISGYLITGILISRANVNLGSVLADFYSRRIRRIFPALIITLLLTYAFGFFAIYSDNFKELGLDIASGSLFLSNFLYLNQQGYFDVDATLRPLLHLWSLGVEEQFYLVWPVLLFWIIHTKHPIRIVYSLIIASFSLNLYFSYSHDNWAYFLPLTRFWELFLGCLLAIQETKYISPKNDYFAGVGLFLIVMASMLINGEENFPGWQVLFPVVGTYLIIKHARNGTIHNVLSTRPLVAIGLISYPLYLYHWPLFSYARITELNPSWLTILILSVVAAFLATGTYIYIERPIRKRGGRGTTIVLSVLLVIIAIFGFSAYQRDGMDFRQVNYQLYKQDIKSFFVPGKKEHSYKSDITFTKPPREYINALKELTSRLKTNDFRKKQEEAFQSINSESHMCNSGDCQDSRQKQLKKTVVIIGDSHADNAYTAIKTSYPDLELHPFTGPGCFPISQRYTNPDSRCSITLRNARQFVQKNKPDLVILASRWIDYFYPVLDDINFYRKYTNHIVLIGPSVRFKIHVKRFLTNYDGSSNIQNYVNSFLDMDKFVLNEKMRTFAKEHDVSFIDKIKAFCGDGYCKLTKTGNELYIPDKGHLNPSGAIMWGKYLQRNKVIDSILANIPHP